MARLELATPEQIREIYSESHAVWGGGLSFHDYLGLWHDLSITTWARKHATYHVWLDERGRILSSLKLYRPRIRMAGKTQRESVLGAIFTPRARRGRGYAADLVRAVIAAGRARGDRLTLLFSDIGTGYYEKLGFVALRAEEQWGTLPRRQRGCPRGWNLRAAEPKDLPQIARAHERFTRSLPFAVSRDEDHWEFILTRSQSYFRRLQDPAIRAALQVVAGEAELEGYLLAVEGRGEWSVREVGARQGRLSTMEAVLRTAAKRVHGLGGRRFYGWLPPELARSLEDWKLVSGARRRAVPMIRVHDPLDHEQAALPKDPRFYLPFLDQF